MCATQARRVGEGCSPEVESGCRRIHLRTLLQHCVALVVV